MAKTVLAAVLALVAGAVAGALFLQAQTEAQRSELEADLARAREDARNNAKLASAAEDEIAGLQAGLYELQNERAELLAKLRALETTPPESDVDLSFFDEAALEDAWTDFPPPPDGGEDGERDRRRGRGWGSDEEREQAFAERRVRMEEYRARIDAEVDATVAGLGPEFAGHMAAITENRAYFEEVRSQLRAAETDEEREAAITEMRAATEANRELVKEVQNGMLRDFAKSHNGQEDIQNGTYVRDMRALLENPVFTMEGMLTGGGPGSPRGGFTGGRGGPGGGRGAFGR